MCWPHASCFRSTQLCMPCSGPQCCLQLCSMLSQAKCAQGSCGDHKLIRQRVCEHMLANRTNFEPFVEDDEEFDDYMRVRIDAHA